MIKNIIAQQDTFFVNNEHQFYSNLPKWMIPKSGFVHPLYEQIWQYVKSDKRDRTCDTNLVSQLLMTSGLPVDVLGGLWSMANIGVEGSLSQQELYIILALITLVQNGYSVSNVSLLQHIHKPIIPQLNYTLIEKKNYASSVKSSIEHKQQITNKSNTSSTVSKNIMLEQNIYTKNFQQPNLNMIPSEDYDPLAVTFIEPKNQMSRIISPLNPEPKSLDLSPVNDNFEAFDDEFSDFQSAQFTNNDGLNKRELTDFSSAFDALSFKQSSTNIIEKDDQTFNAISSKNVPSNLFDSQPNLISYQNEIQDKYEVFRTLAAEAVDIDCLINENTNNDLLNTTSIESNKQNLQNYDVYDDEFGDFLCVGKVSNNKPEIEVDWKNVQVQCINKCLEFLREGFITFSSISDEKVLAEVINHDKGIKYLTQLNLISQICKRILKHCYSTSLEDNLTDVMSKLEIYLNNLNNESTNNSEDLDSASEIIPCYLCKCNCGTDSIEYMLNYYHSSCINLLINFVQTSQLSVK
ncbi:Hypothetical protein CINCED_3A018868 [Cinara cedri]|nr:Hypothetical protein CINCED_3A018868 [Cinara cedri]